MAAYRAADQVVVVTERFRDDLLRRGVPADKVHVVRNGVDIDAFVPNPPDPSVRERLGATNGDALVLYAGAHGISHGLETVAEAAAKLTYEPVRFAFVGEGAAKGQLLDKLGELRLGQRHHPGRRPPRPGLGPAGGRRHLPGAAARRPPLRLVHPVQDVRVPGRGQGGHRQRPG